MQQQSHVFTLKDIGLELHKTMDCHVSWNIKKCPNIRATILDNGIIMLNVSRCRYSCNFSCVTWCSNSFEHKRSACQNKLHPVEKCISPAAHKTHQSIIQTHHLYFLVKRRIPHYRDGTGWSQPVQMLPCIWLFRSGNYRNDAGNQWAEMSCVRPE